MNIHEQDIYFKAKNEGIAQGAEQKALETARKFLAMGLSFEQVAEGTSLPLETVEQLEKEITSL